MTNRDHSNGNHIQSREFSASPTARAGAELVIEDQIPDIVIRRLPIYVRTLRDLQERGTTSVSSDELANHIGVTAAQIRRDLSYFGRFGKQGKGYDAEYLAAEIARILKLDRQWEVALAGFGNLGRAIVHFQGSYRHRFGLRRFSIAMRRHSVKRLMGSPFSRTHS